MKINLPDRSYSIYKQKRTFQKCEICSKYKVCYEVKEVDSYRDEISYTFMCKPCMPNDVYEYYFI